MNPSSTLPPLPSRYRIDRLLGRGGMGAVYKAFDTLLGEWVALKVIFPRASGDEEPSASANHRNHLRDARQEVALARRVTHPHVARVYDLGEHEGTFFVTLELVPGESLRRRIARGALALDDAAQLARQLAAALAAAHHVDVLHLDVKPENVLVVEGLLPRAVLVDFGLARARGAFATGDGTLEYMAPEQLEGMAQGGATDVYALGLVLHEMLTGTRAFAGPDAMARTFARLREAPLPLPAHVPSSIRALTDAMLARAPGERPSAHEVEAGLAAHMPAPVAAGDLAARTPAPEAVDLNRLPEGLGLRLIRARQWLSHIGREDEVIAMGDEVLRYAPRHDAALALRALALTRLWNRTAEHQERAELGERSAAAISDAVAHAAHLADTHVADALRADASGDLGYALRALWRALARDPYHAFAHEVLGRIELEGGFGSGERLELAFTLDAGRIVTRALLAREHYFRGERATAMDLLERSDALHPDTSEAMSLRCRIALWEEHAADARALQGRIAPELSPIRAALHCMMQILCGEASGVDLDTHIHALQRARNTPKRQSFLHQLWAEFFAGRDDARALSHVEEAAALPLSDLRWLEACPPLRRFHGLTRFEQARHVVQERVARALGPREDAPSAFGPALDDAEPHDTWVDAAATTRPMRLSGAPQHSSVWAPRSDPRRRG